MSVTCDGSVVFFGPSGFLYQENWPPRYNWNIVESCVKGVKHHQTNKQSLLDKITSIYNSFYYNIKHYERKVMIYNSTNIRVAQSLGFCMVFNLWSIVCVYVFFLSVFVLSVHIRFTIPISLLFNLLKINKFFIRITKNPNIFWTIDFWTAK